MGKHARTDMDIARDELMSHIHRCGVLKASQSQQDEWLEDTIQYMAERYPNLTDDELSELRVIGSRFCQPVIGRGETALDRGSEENTADGEMAGAA